MRRLWCILWGCGYDAGCGCHRCGAHPYHWTGRDYVEHGRLEWASRLLWRIRGYRAFVRRCDSCGKRMIFTRQYTCSRKCLDNWIPF